MPQVSKRALGLDIRREMFQSLFHALAKISDENGIAKVLDDILTPTERIMFAKRLMAALLIDRWYPYRDISELLKMSTTTINAVHRELRKRGEGYRMIFALFPKRSKLDDLLDATERLLRRSIPPVKGSRASFRRWKQS